MEYFIKNPPKWSEEEIKNELTQFIKIYNDRPIKKNIHGMLFPHMFASYFILKKINPSFVIESGVFKGQSTWLIEKTLPNSKILSIDLDLNKREFISKNATYSNLDFKFHDFSNIPDDTLVFFDDHVNHHERIQQAKFFNIKNIILEDNYKSNEGDFYTIKQSYQNSGFNHKYTYLSNLKTLWIFLIETIKKIFLRKHYFSKEKIFSRLRDQKPNQNDFKNIEKNINTYYEFPPIIDCVSNSTKPILNRNNIDLDISEDEISNYNYITFIQLN